MKYLILVLFILITGCKKREVNQQPEYKSPCTDYYTSPRIKCYPNLALKGYTDNEADTIVLYRYPYNSGFSGQLVSEKIAFKKEYATYFNAPMFGSVYITDTFDYVVEVPGVGKRYYIRSFPVPEVLDTFLCGTGGHQMPGYTLAQYAVVNNDTVKITQNFVNSGYLFINR